MAHDAATDSRYLPTSTLGAVKLGRRKPEQSAEEQFSDEVIVLCRELLGARAKSRPDFALEIARPDGRAITMNLQNVFLEMRDLSGEERAMRLRTALLALAPQPRPNTWDLAAPKLLPAVRAVSWKAAATAASSAQTLHRPFLPYLDLMYAIDFENAMTYVTESDLQAWKVDQNEVERLACNNLLDQPMSVGSVGPLRLIVGPDGYSSSWLATPEALRRVAHDLGDEVIAVAPSRDQLRLLPLHDPDLVVSELRNAEEDYQKEARRLSPVPYLIGVDDLTSWVPSADHPARHHVERAHALLAMFEYEQQKLVLQDLFTKVGDDVFVAQFSLIQRKDGTVWSWAVWAKQVSAGLVPRVDVLLFGDNDNADSKFAVRWDDAMALAGDALQPEPGYEPPRWRYGGWPNGTTVANLRERAVSFPPKAEELPPRFT
jgi:uncharacterized protein YtpQ (UPF0354 family)